MDGEDARKFDTIIRNCFSDGSDYHELRLSEDEVRYLTETYPSLRLEYFADDGSPDSKLWYKVYKYKPK